MISVKDGLSMQGDQESRDLSLTIDPTQLGSTFLSLSEKTFMKIFVELSTTFLIDVKN